MGRKKKRERTEQLKKEAMKLLLWETAQNEIEQYNFNKLIRQGIIVREIEK